MRIVQQISNNGDVWESILPTEDQRPSSQIAVAAIGTISHRTTALYRVLDAERRILIEYLGTSKGWVILSTR